MVSDKYRPEIDGLRAVAVLSVAFFHADLPYVPGGFIGVDIFFVISGYLITRLLIAELEHGRFSLLDFYDRRIRRIIPAFAVVTGVSLLAAFFFLIPGDYVLMARSALAAAGFVANIFFLAHTSYFDPAAQNMPLLHEWTLSVEEQFYLVWPLLLWALWRLPARARLEAIVMLTALGFGFCVWFTGVDQKAAFFLSPFRAWEFLLGALIVFLPAGTRRFGFAVSVVGLALITYAVTQLHSTDPFPGALALYPCVGAALFIYGGWRGPLAMRGPVFVGKISYSFYLWHWPLIVIYRQYAMIDHLDIGDAAGVLAVTFILSALTWRYVEQPFRRHRGWRRSFVFGASAAACLAVISLTVTANDGFAGRFSQSLALTDPMAMWKWKCPQMVPIDEHKDRLYCAVGAPWATAKTHGVLWGDSHAEHYAPLIDVAGKRDDAAFMLVAGCPPFIDNEGVKRLSSDPQESASCAEGRKEMLLKLHQVPSIDTVILAMRWSGYQLVLYQEDPRDRSKREGLQLLGVGLSGLLDDLKGYRVILLGEVPPTIVDLHGCALSRDALILRRGCNEQFTALSRVLDAVGDAREVVRHAAAAHGATFVDPIPAMCHVGQCPTYLDGQFLYRDEHHLRRDLSPTTLADLTAEIGLTADLATPER